MDDEHELLKKKIRDLEEKLDRKEWNFREAQKLAYVGSWNWDIHPGHPGVGPRELVYFQ